MYFGLKHPTVTNREIGLLGGLLTVSLLNSEREFTNSEMGVTELFLHNLVIRPKFVIYIAFLGLFLQF